MKELAVPVDGRRLPALLHQPRGAAGIVVLVHGTGVDRRERRDRRLAAALHATRLATLQPELLDPREAVERHDALDVELQGSRLLEVLAWLGAQPGTRGLPIGLIGADIGAGVVLFAAAGRADEIRAVVCRGGRPDRCFRLPQVRSPTLLLAPHGGWPYTDVYEALGGEKEIIVLPGEPVAREAVAERACHWFARYLLGRREARDPTKPSSLHR